MIQRDVEVVWVGVSEFVKGASHGFDVRKVANLAWAHLGARGGEALVCVRLGVRLVLGQLAQQPGGWWGYWRLAEYSVRLVEYSW